MEDKKKQKRLWKKVQIMKVGQRVNNKKVKEIIEVGQRVNNKKVEEIMKERDRV